MHERRLLQTVGVLAFCSHAPPEPRSQSAAVVQVFSDTVKERLG